MELTPFSPQSFTLNVFFGLSFLALLGGVINFFRRWRAKQLVLPLWAELMQDLLVSSLAGLASSFAAFSITDSLWIGFIAAAVGGHQGTRMLKKVEQHFLSKLSKDENEDGSKS